MLLMFNGAGLAFISSSVVLVINSLIPRANSSVWKHAAQPHGSVVTVLAQTLNFELRSAFKSFVGSYLHVQQSSVGWCSGIRYFLILNFSKSANFIQEKFSHGCLCLNITHLRT